MANDRNPLGKINNATPNGGIYLEPGAYLVDINVCKLVDGFKGDSFVAEFKILESSNPVRPTGSNASWVANFAHPSGPGNIRDFVAKCLKSPFEAITEDHVRACVSEANVLRGTQMRVIAVHVPTKRGGIFTKHSWTHHKGGPADQQPPAPAIAPAA